MHLLLLILSLLFTPLAAGAPFGTAAQEAISAPQQQETPTGEQPSNDVMQPREMVEEPAPFTQQSITSSMLKMVSALLGILLLLFFATWGIRRLQRGRFSQIQINRRIKILERRPLSPKSVLYLIEYDGKKVLIAESQLEVRPLTAPDGQAPLASD